ncbi:cytochrome P450 [Aulographum hederae CBS 113979]|uniref:Cytochrome P450 n=1 Tax=Aulographum hederae CBS 113979 TaxID=1176131 RepID=A0A6G1H7L7_9PEZI|nr:cytochrome P450 [Aulographum hederae CBS 113979]
MFSNAVLVGPALVFMLVFSSAVYIWQRFFSLRGLPDNLPWAGAEKGALSRAIASKRSLFGLKELIIDGYEKYSKRDQPFILPNLATGPEVVLPMTQMKWLLEQPDHVLSQHRVNFEFLHANRTMLHPKVARDAVHSRVIRRELTKDLDMYASDIVDEIEHSLALNWGTDIGVWKEVALYDTMLDVISRLSNRVLVGKTLCRNEEFLHSSSMFLKNMAVTAGLLNLCPDLLRPFASPFLMAYDYFHYRKIAKHIFPIVKERTPQFHAGMDYKNSDYSQHNDYIQWALHDAYSHDDPEERTPELISKRLAVLSFAAIQSSIITITNTLFDIAASPDALSIQSALREETASKTQDSSNFAWVRSDLRKLIRIDSAIRESMRLWGFISRGVMKSVVVPQGVTIPSGEHLPFGTKVGVTSYAVHHDESIYPNAMAYDPFRFSRLAEDPQFAEKTAEGEREREGTPEEALKAPGLITSTNTFMAFSHGRHACPGRFFAANQLKLLLAHIILHYDIEPIASRPENPWLNNAIGPPLWAKLRVQRRADPTSPPTTAASPVLNDDKAVLVPEVVEVKEVLVDAGLAVGEKKSGFGHGIVDDMLLAKIAFAGAPIRVEG